jgi:hypothetical protein
VNHEVIVPDRDIFRDSKILRVWVQLKRLQTSV